MDSEDGQIFVKNLAYFVRTHERALANALQSQRQRTKHGQLQATAGAASSGSSEVVSTKLSEALSRSYYRPFSSSQNVKPQKLTLTPHHLFYLLSKFEDLGVDIGPMNVRLENLQLDAAPANYVSFLGHAPRTRGKQSDAESLKSVSSVRSVMSSMSSLWSNLTLSNSAAKAEKAMAVYREDIRYLYSCFTKIPTLKLSPDSRARLVAGYEEFPFDTAVSLFAFKNVSSLEISDLDFRQFHGWDRLAEQLRSLTAKRANVEDPTDLLRHIVLDDMEKRRKRSFKTLPTTPSTPGAPWPTNSPKARQMEFARTMSAPNSPFATQRRGSKGSPQRLTLDRKASDDKEPSTPHHRQRSNSPTRVLGSGQGSLPKQNRESLKYRRTSASSGSSTRETTPRHSSTDLLALGILPPTKWRVLRHLSLADNGLTSLTVASLAPVAGTLQSLDLSSNLFTEVPDALASLTHLRALNLSNCMINSLQSLARNPLPAITTLNLRSNRLQNLSGIERLFSLERVDLRDNWLRDPTELARLTAIPEIVDLYVVKNPFIKTHSNYRVTIFNLFRSTPGYTQDITIDTLGPMSNEKKMLVDRAPEPANVPVVRPPVEDEEEEETFATGGGAPTEAELQALGSEQAQAAPQHRTHRRATSDFGPQSMHRKKKAPRRRLVELSQADSQSRAVSQPDPPELALVPPRTPTDSDQPTTPGETPYHTAPTKQAEPLSTQHRPTLDTAFNSPTPNPKIRESSDDDLSPARSPQDIGHSDVYRQKIEALKHDLGPNWLTAMNEDRLADERARNRSFSPASRTSTIRPDSKASGQALNVTGRTLG